MPALNRASKRLSCVVRFSVDVCATGMNPLKELEENEPVTGGAASAICVNWAKPEPVNEPKYVNCTPVMAPPEMNAVRPRSNSFDGKPNVPAVEKEGKVKVAVLPLAL